MQISALGLIIGLIVGLVVTVAGTLLWPKNKLRFLRGVVPALVGVLVTVAALFLIK